MKTKHFKYVIFAIILGFFSFLSFIIGVLLTNLQINKIENKYQIQLNLKEKQISKLKTEINNLKKEIKKRDKLFYSLINTPPSEILDYKIANCRTLNNKSNKIKQKFNKIFKSKKPELVIILDDVAFYYQVKAIKNLPFKATPSFFPPTQMHPNTPKYAKEFKDYMVHVPMQALHFSHPEPNTMEINWSYNQIKKRIENIKQWFPEAKFINNHTGSKFTADLKEMKYLFEVLKEEKLGFVDSKTTPFSKGKIVEKIYHIPFFERNIFLDNEQNVNYIKNQLKKAVEIAKKRGYAIAIGHPHEATIEALKSSKDILQNVNVITINELYRLKDENGNKKN